MVLFQQRILSALSAYQAVIQEHVADLSRHGWTLSNRLLNVSVPATVPGHVHLDLYASGLIDHPLHDLNEFDLRWIALNNWTYTSEPLALRNDVASTWLRFDGLDTFTAVYFCDVLVANTDNQFRQYLFNITDLLHSCHHGHRRIKLEFGSAPAIANLTATAPDQEMFPAGIQFVYEFHNAYYIR